MKQNLKYVTRMGLKGLLDKALHEPANIVNAEFIAQQRGMTVVEKTSADAGDYKSLVEMSFTTAKGKQMISGIVTRVGPRITSINGYTMDLVPKGNVIIADHINRPGVVGPVCVLLGKYNINISNMQVGKVDVGSESLMILAVDDLVPAKVMKEVAESDGIISARFMQL